MKGRKPYPFEVMKDKNKQNRIPKNKLESRGKNQPKIESSKLECPKHLSDEAKTEWKRIINLYKKLDQPLITDLDINGLEIYCESIIIYRKAMQKVKETSEIYKSEYGPKVNPWLKVANDASMQVKKYGEILLLDPVSRARVGLAKSKEEEIDPMEALLGGG